MRSRSDSVFAPLPLQDSASPDLDLSSIAHIPPTPDSPPYQIRKSSPRRNSQLGTPSKSSRRRSRTVSQGDRGGRNLPTPTHSSDSEEGGREGIVLYGRDTQNSVMVEIGQEENQKSRRGSSSTRMSEGEGDYLVGGRDRDGGAGTADEDQDPMLQQIARERQLVWEQTRSRNLGRKKWLILVTSSESSTSLRQASSSRESSISSSMQSEGVLLPLQPTLPAQAQLIAREFSLSSISGIQLYLCLPKSPTSRARLTESSWRVLWADHLEGRSHAETLRGANGLPIAGHIEFDVDDNRSRRLLRRIDRPRPAFSTFTPPRSASPALRFGTSLPYSRSTTPSWSETCRNETRHSSHLDETESDAELEQSVRPTPSFPLRFQPRPLSTLSQTLNNVHNPASSSTSHSTSRATTPVSRPGSRGNVRSLFDSAYGNLPEPSTEAAKKVKLEESTLPIQGQTTSAIFSFPRPESRGNTGDESSEERSREESTLNWTIELDRLREVSETSLFAGGSDHDASMSGEADTSGVALLDSIRKERVASYVTLLSLPVPIEPLSLATLPSRQPVVQLPSMSATHYPHLSIYPSAYPHIDLYPRRFASNLPPFQCSEDSLNATNSDLVASIQTHPLPVITIGANMKEEASQLVSEEANRQNEVSTFEADFIDTSVDWYLSSTPSEASPGSSSFEEEDEDEGEGTSDSDGEGLFAVYEGTMLSVIQEESDTRSLTAQMDDSRDGRVIETIMEEATNEYVSEQSEKMSSSERDESIEVPVITYSKPSISYTSQADHSQSSRLPSLELDRATSSPSPLPSPTITPSSKFPADLPEAPEDAEEQDELDYSFEYEAEVGTDELPYITSPGLKHALGLDDSPEIQPLSFPSDESESDSDESFYKTRDFALDRQGLDHFTSGSQGDDSCQTFDHLTPLPETSTAEDDSKPILFVFPSSDSRDMLDAIAQFVCEAQTQSIDRRGKFRVAFGTEELPRMLRLALENDERIEWEKWEIFFVESKTNGTSRTIWEEHLFAYFPITPSQIHLPQANDDGVKPLSEEYERQLLSAFPGVGLFAGDSIPRFDLVLLDVEEQARILQLSETLSNANRWITTTSSSRISFTPSLLSASRRIAVLALGPTQQPLLTNVLTESDGNERENVVYFADELAVEGLSYPRTSFWDD